MDNKEALHLGLLLGSVRSTLVNGIATRLIREGYDQSPPTYHALAHLHYLQGATAATLARHLELSKQAGCQLVAELVSKNYAQRRKHRTDGRAQEVTLTDGGQELLRAAETAAGAIAGRWRRGLTPERMDELYEDLWRIRVVERSRWH